MKIVSLTAGFPLSEAERIPYLCRRVTAPPFKQEGLAFFIAHWQNAATVNTDTFGSGVYPAV